MNRKLPNSPRAFDFAAVEEILRCPRSGARLVMDEQSLVSCDPATRMRYEIRDGIPILLSEEAKMLEQSQWEAIMRAHGHDPATGAPQPPAVEPKEG